jgi:8-oxo-dGTP pyrophosphatase MutT (NUDIX family)
MRFQVVPAAYVLFLDGDRILLQLRQNTGYRDGHWACAAAGHVEDGESVFEAAVREAAEEVDVAVQVADLEPLTGMHRTHGNGRPIDERVDFFFACRRWVGEPRRREPAKQADLQWFPLDDLPSPVVPHESAVFDAFRSGRVPPVMTFGF